MPSGDLESAKSDETGHGTCCASKAAGNLYGIAKNANLVVVKLPRAALFSDLMYALDEIEKHADLQSTWGNAVLSSSCSWIDLDPYSRADLTSMIYRLLIKGMIIVQSSGNNGSVSSAMHLYG